MKQPIFVMLLICLPVLGFAQSHAATDKVMQRFQRFYNDGRADSIVHMFNPPKTQWCADGLAAVKRKYGQLKSYKYVTVDSVTDANKLSLYKITTKKKVFMMALDVEPDGRPGTFSFHRSSAYIDSLLKGE